MLSLTRSHRLQAVPLLQTATHWKQLQGIRDTIIHHTCCSAFIQHACYVIYTYIPCLLILSKLYLPSDAQLNYLNTLRTGDADLRF